MKECYKEKGYTTYEYFIKEKIIAISKDVHKDNNDVKKSSSFQIHGKESVCFFIIYVKKLIL